MLEGVTSAPLADGGPPPPHPYSSGAPPQQWQLPPSGQVQPGNPWTYPASGGGGGGGGFGRNSGGKS